MITKRAQRKLKSGRVRDAYARDRGGWRHVAEKQDQRVEKLWRETLLGTNPADRAGRTLFAALPSPPRCELCAAPFKGPFAPVLRLIGDQVVGYFVPGFAGHDHARRAIETGLELLRATGHVPGAEPWVPVGAGVHTGSAFIGTVGRAEGQLEITALGEDVNVAARLASVAATGELVCSEAAYQAAGLDLPGERRTLALKGVSLPIEIRALRSST